MTALPPYIDRSKFPTCKPSEDRTIHRKCDNNLIWMYQHEGHLFWAVCYLTLKHGSIYNSTTDERFDTIVKNILEKKAYLPQEWWDTFEKLLNKSY